LEAAKREAEQELQEITYKRTSAKRPAKPKTDSFPAHLRREEQVAPLSDEDQKQADAGAAIERILVNEVLHYRKPELFVKAYFKTMLLEDSQGPQAKKTLEECRLSLPAGLEKKVVMMRVSLPQLLVGSSNTLCLTIACKMSSRGVAGHRAARPWTTL